MFKTALHLYRSSWFPNHRIKKCTPLHIICTLVNTLYHSVLQRLCRCADFFAKIFFSWIFWQGSSNCSPRRRGFLFAALSFQRITRIFTYLILKDKLSVEIREIRGGWQSPPNLPLLRGGTWIAWQANCAPSWKGGGRGLWVRTRSVGFAIRILQRTPLS